MPTMDYDDVAEAYATANEKNLFNAWYARPAMLDLAGDVAGRRILDAGCGSGTLTEELRERGAIVSGLDQSAKMVELARRRLGENADLVVHDLADPLPYDDSAFDDVVSSLVLHYLEGWDGPLAELHRVLKPGGRLIVAVNHPLIYPFSNPDGGYFDVVSHTWDYEFDGHTIWFTNWHRPLSAMTEAFTTAGFRINVISEPPVAPDTPEELLPDGKRRFISFLFFLLEAD